MRKVVHSSRPPAADIRAAIMEYARRHGPGRPILIGDVCLHLGWWATLVIAETALEALVEDGALKHLSKEECTRRGILHAYVLAV